MKKILILCEGQTEETFVNRILAPHLYAYNKYPIPTSLVTKKAKSGRTFRGGITSYARVRRDVLHLLRDSSAACVTTILDYYGLPGDFPGKSTLHGRTPYDRVAWLEQQFAHDINEPRFLPYLMLHEFEALLFAQPETILQTLNQSVLENPFGNVNAFSSPEEINEGRDTHPAARILRHLKGYRKPLHGPLIIERIGLPTIRTQCPHFNEWLETLERL